MAIETTRRENLLRDATAYTRRVLFKSPGADASDTTGASLAEEQPASPTVNAGKTDADELFLGLRSDGGWSVYFGEDPVFQFNAANQLRRAYVAGVRYEANAGQLVELGRDSSGGRVQMIRQPVSASTAAALLTAAQELLDRGSTDLLKGSLIHAGHVPESASTVEIVAEFTQLLSTVSANFVLAESPYSGGSQQ